MKLPTRDQVGDFLFGLAMWMGIIGIALAVWIGFLMLFYIWLPMLWSIILSIICTIVFLIVVVFALGVMLASRINLDGG